MIDRWIDMRKYEALLTAVPGGGERPADAIEWTQDVLRWMGTGHGQRAIESHMSQYAGAKYDPVPGVPSALQDRAKALYYSSSLHHVLDGSTIVYVTARMVDLAVQIANDMPCLPLLEDDLPATHGVFWFQKPVPLFEYAERGTSHPDQRYPGRMIAWASTIVKTLDLDGVTMQTIHDDDDVDDPMWSAGPGVDIYVLGRWDEIGRAVQEHHNDEFDAYFDARELDDPIGAHMWMPLETTGWRFNYEWRELTRDEVDALEEHEFPPPGTCIPELAWLRRFIWAVCVLVAQEVAGVSTAPLDRPARRRAERALPRFSGVRVVRLRRIYDPTVTLTDEERAERKRLDHHWSHRWKVKEHWAWRACGPNRSQRRRVLIREYVKGPEDAPLVERPTVWSLER